MNQALTVAVAAALAVTACRSPEPGYSAADLPPLPSADERAEEAGHAGEGEHAEDVTWTGQADADALASAEDAAPAPVDEGWTVVVKPYLFGAGLRGTIGLTDADGDVDADFSDLLGELDFGGAVGLELAPPDSKLRLLLDLTYVAFEEDGSTTETGFDRVDAELDQLMAEATLALELQPEGQVDLLLGARYWDLDGDLKAIATPPGSDVSASRSASWVEPLIGLRSRIPLAGSLGLLLRADVGGFGLGSEYTYDLGGQLAWSFSKSFELALGYRHLFVKYDDDGFLYEVSSAGPVVGLNWTL
jgi:hypothetical protein